MASDKCVPAITSTLECQPTPATPGYHTCTLNHHVRRSQLVLTDAQAVAQWCTALSTTTALMITTNTRVTHYVLQSGFSTTLATTLSTPVFRRNPPKPLQPAVNDTRPRWLGHVQNDALDECSGIFGILKLLLFKLPFDGREQKPVTGG